MPINNWDACYSMTMEFESSIEHLQQVLRLHALQRVSPGKKFEATELREHPTTGWIRLIVSLRFGFGSRKIAALSMSRIKCVRTALELKPESRSANALLNRIQSQSPGQPTCSISG